MAVTAASWLLSACGTSPAVEQALSAPLVIPDAVQQTILDQVEPAPVPKFVKSMVSSEAIDHRGNFGKIVSAKAVHRHALTPQGLLDVTVSVDLKDGESTGTSETFSLCGLVSIATTGGNKIGSPVTTAIPVGKLFLPSTFTTNIDRATSGRLSTLSVKSGRLCAPVPGQTLSFSLTFQTFYRVKGMFTMSGSREVTQDVQCTPAESRQSAEAIGFEGDYLPVHCEVKDAKNEKTWTKEYAFLDATRLYVLLSAKNDWQTSKATYSDVVYER
jgi:hypothetical protein